SLTPLGGSPIAGVVALDPTGTIATFSPAVPLLFATQYTARIDTTIQASDGTPVAAAVSWTFTTRPAPPTVTANTPANGATGVSLLVAPTATFSKSMSPASLTSAFTLTKSGATGPVAATVSYDDASKTATLTPSAPLDQNATYV